MHRPQAGTVFGSIRRENRAGGLNPAALWLPAGRREEMHKGARPLPAAHGQFVMRRTAVFGDAPVMTSMLMLFRMPDDHDLQHADDRAPWSLSVMLARQPEVGQHSPGKKVPKIRGGISGAFGRALFGWQRYWSGPHLPQPPPCIASLRSAIYMAIFPPGGISCAPRAWAITMATGPAATR